MKTNKKTFIGIILISILFISLIYITNIASIPKNIIIFQGERLNLNTLVGIDVKPELKNVENLKTVQASSNLEFDEEYTGKINLSVNLFGINIKDITVNVLETTEVVPLGELVGLKLYTNGVLVVGMSEISGIDKNTYKPYENTGILEGDMIVEINEKSITNTTERKEISVKYVRDGETIETNIKPVETDKDDYKLGLWVRDAAAGVGTISFYEPETGLFASLGHGIIDVDTSKLLDISTGEFVTTNIVSITKGEKGNPGKIQGSVENQKTIGEVYKNTEFGVFGKVSNTSVLNEDLTKTIKVASRNEIKKGKATIRCTLENNKKKEYEVEIQKIYANNNSDNKSMLVKITDEELLEKTGGIIQGMSGSPIIQNGKLIGVLTHVLVSDPTVGYGVFADLMVEKMKE